MTGLFEFWMLMFSMAGVFALFIVVWACLFPEDRDD